jgi:defect-in-organelle-trafficking protein DotC
MRIVFRPLHSVWMIALVAVLFSDMATAQDRPVPLTREQLENIQPSTTYVKTLAEKDGEGEGMPFNIRINAIKEAALSYGARGGLVWRTYEIRQELEKRSAYLDKVFDFSRLLIPAPSGLLIEPPVISEDDRAMIIADDGQEAAVADRIYRININAQIVSTARLWRNYLERDWGEVQSPPDLLLPQNEKEREMWIKWIREGWQNGVEQADEIFNEDLAELTKDYHGMTRYRMLLAQGVISPPFALLVDRGVTGGGDQLRVGDRAVRITGRPEFNPGYQTWQPASR